MNEEINTVTLKSAWKLKDSWFQQSYFWFDGWFLPQIVKNMKERLGNSEWKVNQSAVSIWNQSIHALRMKKNQFQRVSGAQSWGGGSFSDGVEGVFHVFKGISFYFRILEVFWSFSLIMEESFLANFLEQGTTAGIFDNYWEITRATISPNKATASAKMSIKIIPTKSLSCWALALTPASPTIPMAKPAPCFIEPVDSSSKQTQTTIP